MCNRKNNNSIIYDYKNRDRFIVINTRPGRHGMVFIENNDGLITTVSETPKECLCSLTWRKIEITTLNDNMSV